MAELEPLRSEAQTDAEQPEGGKTRGTARCGPEITMTILLPPDVESVPMVRHLCGYALSEMGADQDSIEAVELAVTEACANVVQHAQETHSYRVTATLDHRRCELSVLDSGRGFSGTMATEMVPPEAESGRGLMLISSLMDRFSFRSEPQSGMLMHFVKEIGRSQGRLA